ncbi:MAG: hypothetical protein AAFX87_30885 [Bacteroidota bacterium]
MKKILLTILPIILVLIISNNVHAQDDVIPYLRNKLFYTPFDVDKSFTFYKEIKAIKDKTPLIEAYKGAAEAVIAEQHWNPISKLSYLKQSLKTLSGAIQDDMENVEIRFIRFYIESNAPRLLGLSGHIDEDKSIIMSNLYAVDKEALGNDLVKYIVGYMIESGLCTPQEISIIKSRLTYY